MNEPCPLCGCWLRPDTGTPPPHSRGRRAKPPYVDFDCLDVGDSVICPWPQTNTASRVAAWKRAKTHPERHNRRFVTRRVTDTATQVWRTA